MRTYNDLKNAVIALVDREDFVVSDEIGTGMTDKADQWIANAVRSFYRTDAARTAPFELFVTGTLNEGVNNIPIPADFRELRRIIVTRDGRSQPLEYTTSDDVMTDINTSRYYLPMTFGREGGRWFTQRPSANVSYTVYYYGSLSPIEDITQTNYSVTVANYHAGRVALSTDTTAAQLFFPTGTTREMVMAGIGVSDSTASNYLLPTAAATATNTVSFRFTGNEITHWLLNNAGEILMYLAAVEAGLFYDATDSSLESWRNIARDKIDQLIRDFQRMDGSGTTPLQRRPGLYNRPSIYVGSLRGFGN